MIVTGETLPAAQFSGTALFDAVTDGDVVDAAVALAGKVVQEVLPHKRLRDLKVREPQAEAFLQFARNSVAASAGPYPAPLKCVEAVSWSISKPFDEALRLERDAFLQLMASAESRAMRHNFAAERLAGKVADLPDGVPLRQIHKVGVIGAGTMGGGIAMNFLNVGIPVVLLETQQQALDRGLSTIRRNYENFGEEGQAHRRTGGTAHEPGDADAGLRCAGRCRPGGRSGVRKHGRQAASLCPSGRSLQARCHPGFEHVLPGHRPHRHLHQTAA